MPENANRDTTKWNAAEQALEKPLEERTGELVMASQPHKKSYGPGEPISYSGARFLLPDGKDVTAYVTYSIEELSAYRADAKTQEVCVKYTDEHQKDFETSFTIKRRPNLVLALIVALLAASVGLGIVGFIYFHDQPEKGDTGSYIIPKGEMSDEQAQEMLDDMTERSRIKISVAPKMRLKENGMLRVNFIVEEPNNGLSERIELEQGGRVVYSSGVVQPGYMVEWGQSEGAVEGEAVATVYAVRDGIDTGNPTSVEVEIVGGGTGGSAAGEHSQGAEG